MSVTALKPYNSWGVLWEAPFYRWGAPCSFAFKPFATHHWVPRVLPANPVTTVLSALLYLTRDETNSGSKCTNSRTHSCLSGETSSFLPIQHCQDLPPRTFFSPEGQQSPYPWSQANSNHSCPSLLRWGSQGGPMTLWSSWTINRI